MTCAGRVRPSSSKHSPHGRTSWTRPIRSEASEIRRIPADDRVSSVPYANYSALRENDSPLFRIAEYLRLL